MAVDREAHKCQKEDKPSQNPERIEKNGKRSIKGKQQLRNQTLGL